MWRTINLGIGALIVCTRCGKNCWQGQHSRCIRKNAGVPHLGRHEFSPEPRVCPYRYHWYLPALLTFVAAAVTPAALAVVYVEERTYLVLALGKWQHRREVQRYQIHVAGEHVRITGHLWQQCRELACLPEQMKVKQMNVAEGGSHAHDVVVTQQ